MKNSKLNLLVSSIAVFSSLLFQACEKVEDPKLKLTPIDLNSISSPNPSDFSSETDLAIKYQSEILPLFQSKSQSGTFTGARGNQIHYYILRHDNKKGAVVILPGRTEPALKYIEVAVDLYKQRYEVYILDHRGQGESEGRVQPYPQSDYQIGYVTRFEDFVDDAKTFVETVVKPRGSGKRYLLAHSMGGAVAAMYAHLYPNDFSAIALSAPMLEIDTGSVPSTAAWNLVTYEISIGNGKKYASGQSDFNFNLQYSDADNDVTRSEARFNIKMALYNSRKDIVLGGVSNQWLYESLNAGKKIKTFSSQILPRILMLEAGTDKVVKVGAEEDFCTQAMGCQSVYYSSSMHEILMEKDSVRNDAMSKIVRFFDSL